jgi:hypothetical protein
LEGPLTLMMSRLRCILARGNEIVSRRKMVDGGELTITLNPTSSFAQIVMCEAISSRIVSLARMLSSALRCAGAVALAGFRSVWRSDGSERHS